LSQPKNGEVLPHWPEKLDFFLEICISLLQWVFVLELEIQFSEFNSILCSLKTKTVLVIHSFQQKQQKWTNLDNPRQVFKDEALDIKDC